MAHHTTTKTKGHTQSDIEVPRIGFEADPTGGPGIFMTRLKKRLQVEGFFDDENPNIWIQLCYNPIPEHITKDKNILKIIRTDGAYNLHHQLFPFPLPSLDVLWSRRQNQRKNKTIIKNLKKADGIIFQSEFSRTVVNRFACQTKPGVIIYNGINTETFSPAEDKLTKPEDLHILISHSFRPHKRLHEAIKIIDGLKKEWPQRKVTLHVVGDDRDGTSFEAATQVIQKLDLEGAIKFHGKQPYNKLFDIYRQCDFALGLSFWDFCPNVIIEMLSCGLPIIGVNFGGIPELVGNAGILIDEDIRLDYMDLYNVDALPEVPIEKYVSAVATLLPDIAEYKQLARQQALSNLDIRLTAKRYIQYAAQLLAEKK